MSTTQALYKAVECVCMYAGCDGKVQGDWPQELEGLPFKGLLPDE